MTQSVSIIESNAGLDRARNEMIERGEQRYAEMCHTVVNSQEEVTVRDDYIKQLQQYLESAARSAGEWEQAATQLHVQTASLENQVPELQSEIGSYGEEPE